MRPSSSSGSASKGRAAAMPVCGAVGIMGGGGGGGGGGGEALGPFSRFRRTGGTLHCWQSLAEHMQGIRGSPEREQSVASKAAGGGCAVHCQPLWTLDTHGAVLIQSRGQSTAPLMRCRHQWRQAGGGRGAGNPNLTLPLLCGPAASQRAQQPQQSDSLRWQHMMRRLTHCAAPCICNQLEA